VTEGIIKTFALSSFFLLGILLAPKPLWADASKPPTNEMLLERIEQLERRAEQQARQQIISEMRTKYPSLNIIGFGNTSFSTTDEAGKTSGFRMGQFVLHFSSALSPRVSFFGEMSITARRDAGEGDPKASGFDVEIERNIIRFDQGDHLKISIGRFHTPINWWNAAFHHGIWLQTTIDRPSMLGTLVPIHFMGITFQGALGKSSLNLAYNVGMGNGRGKVLGRAGDAGDVNNNKAWFVNVLSKPDRFFGLDAGFSAYGDQITTASGAVFDEMIFSAHLIWSKENPEVISEYANIRHEAKVGGRTFEHQSAYLQIAYRLPWLEARFKPYARYEYNELDSAEPTFTLSSLFERRAIAGLRFDVSTYAAFKLEYRKEKKDSGLESNSGLAQVSFTF